MSSSNKARLFAFAERSRLLDLADRAVLGHGQRLTVLAYHRVDTSAHRPWLDPGVISATPEMFESQMRLLARRYHPVTLEAVLRALENKAPLPVRAVLVTVDDGYRDFQEEIFPRAIRYGIRPVLFVTTGMVGGGFFWWDALYRAVTFPVTSILETELGRFPVSTPEEKKQALSILSEKLKHLPFDQTHRFVSALVADSHASIDVPTADTLGWEELRALDHAGAYICAHTHTHPILSQVPLIEARDEIRKSQDLIQREIGHAWPVFAYPEGKPHAITPNLVHVLREEGFRLAFSTVEGVAQFEKDDPLCLPRVGIWPGLSLGQFHFRLTPLYRLRMRGVTSELAQGGSPKKFLLVRVWEKPPYEKSIAGMLADAFPDFEMETFALGRMLKKRPDILLWNAVQTFSMYGRALLRRKISFVVAFYGTPYLFRKTRDLFLKQILPRRGEFAFSFLVHSLFDVSVPGLAHYVYTDRTLLANLNYPGFDREKAYSDDWVACERDIYRHASHIFTWSADITRSLMEQYSLPREKLTCAYVGFNAPPLDGPMENAGYSNQNILFVGIEWERKGGPALLRAFREVRKSFPNARLTVVGPSLPTTELGVSVAGLVPLEQIGDYYRTASIFCLPTTWEAFGIAFIEAMAYKLPVVGTNLGAIPDFILPGETGQLVNLGDEKALASGLIDLLGNPSKCRRMGEAAYQLVQGRYNWQQVGSVIRSIVLATETERSTS